MHRQPYSGKWGKPYSISFLIIYSSYQNGVSHIILHCAFENIPIQRVKILHIYVHVAGEFFRIVSVAQRNSRILTNLQSLEIPNVLMITNRRIAIIIVNFAVGRHTRIKNKISRATLSTYKLINYSVYRLIQKI